MLSACGDDLRLDARTLTDRTKLSCDVCVIGAGPAGITIALMLLESRADVLVIESGGPTDERGIQGLNEGQVVGDSYAGLRATRQRGLGGSARLWNTDVHGGAGAKYVPLDPRDFEAMPSDGALPGWPLDYATLEPYYRRAQSLCGLGPFAYEASAWERPGRAAWQLLPDAALTSGVYQFGPQRLFTVDYVKTLHDSGNVRLCDHATLVSLARIPNGGFEARLRATTTASTIEMQAGVVVLATGAIENARILLVAADRIGATPAAIGKWAGRCFMEHPRDTALILSSRSPEFARNASFYDAYSGSDGVMTCGRLGLQPKVDRASQPASFSVSLQPDQRPPGRLRRLLRRAGLRQKKPGYGWSQLPDVDQRLARFRLLINMEQRPRPENRLVLSPARDVFGVPRIALHWSWNDFDQSQLEAARKLIRAEIEAAGLGTVNLAGPGRPDPNAHHHAGTTRMAVDARCGVVDSDCRVHGTENLYVVGASVFPSAGWANPTLTSVALAIRLAEHLQERL